MNPSRSLMSSSEMAIPHEDALVLTIEIGSHMVKRILVDPGSAVDLFVIHACSLGNGVSSNISP